MRCYDYLLAGSTGQVGRYLLKELKQLGSVAVTTRGDKCWPKAEHVVNAAGFTTLANGPYERYWEDNIMLAVQLVKHAKDIGASFHQLSSIAVGEFRDDVLTEVKDAIPDVRQLRYSTSKVLVEMAVTAVLPEAQIFRIGDVVPSLSKMEVDWRRKHWLSILFGCGARGFQYAPMDYNVWLVEGAELARAITLLMEYSGRRYHVLGCKYSWDTFRTYAEPIINSSLAIAKWMTDIILHGPEASMVDDTMTKNTLRGEGFEWTKLEANYWRAFAKRSVKR